ncbi:FAD-binding oxidoreductase [Amycolatopsis sp. WAC 04182]|uniref:NAD(P)/FAD-dependent oxidoreductase n=1 Tax=Amycolatopsis sp. WAC 04182 TaxID=2203198 RepID=UPI0013159604|nr:FAD-binding oxidoreductase [Amycolatopsis sp. WAC 04182]
MTSVYWRDVLPERVSAPEPPPASADIVVIGAGFAGLSIALDLLEHRPGGRVIVLEARHAGFGASGRNAGGVLPLGVLPWLLPGSAGAHDPREMQRLLHDRIDTRMRELRGLHPAGEITRTRMRLIGGSAFLAAGLDVVADAVTASGIEVEQEAAGFSLGSWTIQPAALAESLAAELSAAGGALFENSPADSVEPADDGVVVRLRSGQVVRADRVVVCTGAYTGGLSLPDPPAGRVVHTYMRAGEPEDVDDDLFRTAPELGMAYWRRHRGRLLFGGLDLGGLTPGAEADALPRAHHKVDRLLARRLPAEAGTPATHRWGGPLHVSSAEVPQLARSAVTDRVVYAVGFAGSGVALTLTAGPLVRDLVLGPGAADPEGVALREAMTSTTIPWRGVLGALRRGPSKLARRLLHEGF